jgi:Transposase DDE domain
VTGDTKYATVENIRVIEEQGLRAYVPLADWDRTAYSGPSKFTDDAEQDEHRCPQGQPLRRQWASYTTAIVLYRADPAVCNACPVKAACTASNEGRTISRSCFAEYVDRVRGYQDTAA